MDTTYLFPPGVPPTFSVSADVTGGQLVDVSGNRSVAPADAASNGAWVGTAAYDAKTGEKVAVLVGGVQRIVASGTVTAGDQVVAAAAGKIATRNSGTPEDATEVVGLALTGGTDVAVEILMAR